MHKKKKRVIELTMTPEMCLDAIALVQSPAIEENFMCFSANEKFTFARVDMKKRMVIGPALIPNKLIPRFDPETNEEYDVFFSEATVEQIAHQYLIYQKQHAVNVEHLAPVEGACVVEAWLVLNGENDKAKELGYSVPNITWMVGMSVTNNSLLDGVESGKLKGFSIEGYFVNQAIKNNKFKMTKEKFASATAADGTVMYYDGDLNSGTQVFSDEAMTTPIADGDYSMPDGSTVSVASGAVTEVKAAETTPVANADATQTPATPAPAEPAAPAAADSTLIDQLSARIDDLNQRIMALEDSLALSNDIKEQLATALSKIDKLSDTIAPKSVTLSSDSGTKKVKTLEERAKELRELIKK